MIKLYKQIGDKMFYKECWYDGSAAIVHRGVVGNDGITETHPCEDFERFSADFMKKFQKQGYRPLADSGLTTIAVRLQFPSEASALASKDSVTRALNERLGWRGLGHVDGYDIDAQTNPAGGRSLSIFCTVVEEHAAKREISRAMETLQAGPYTLETTKRPAGH